MASIKQMIADQGGRPIKIHGSDEGLQEVGIPDLLICIYGRFVGMEVKQLGKGLRPTQKVLLREIFTAGGVAAVVETTGQAALLLSHLKKESGIAPQARLFYRGNYYRNKSDVRWNHIR